MTTGIAVARQISINSLTSYLSLARPLQWTKNLLVFAPLFFSGDWSLAAFKTLLSLFVCFCLSSSAIYCINDCIDLSLDRLHPTKKLRPLPAGLLSRSQAIWFAALLLLASSAISALLPLSAMALLSLYTILGMLYSLKLKRIPIVDISMLTFFLLLRLVAGAVAVSVTPSSWILLCTTTGGLMLATNKRYAEMHTVRTQNETTRPVLQYYNESMLRSLIHITAFTSVIMYSAWCISVSQTGHRNITILHLTIIPVIFGTLRYNTLQQRARFHEDPVRAMYSDPLITLALCSFAFLHFWLLYAA